MQRLEDERQRLCREYDHQKEAKLAELKAASERRQILDNKDTNVSVTCSEMRKYWVHKLVCSYATKVSLTAKITN